jgi:hypothetical protein
MAWLIHEPSLRAEVPVFCVQAVHPLLSSTPYSVAIGAWNLLLHLHSGEWTNSKQESHSFAVFQILVKDEYSHSESRIVNGEVASLSSFEEGDGLETAGETPALWR